MNKAITEGLVLMPPPFSAGLNLWSSGNGRPGDASYLGAPNAALVTNDQDFGGCLEMQKTTTTQKLRSFAQTPLRADMYLRVTAKVKAVSGNLPSVRIAAWVGTVAEANVAGVVQTGPAVTLTQYGQIVTVEAIVGAGNRTGVTMAWGNTAAFAHIGLDLTGTNGGVVRIEDLVVEDVTNVFIRDMIDLVDVRDYGAIGNGVVNDTAAFLAADAAAAGRTILVSAGTYALPGNLTINSRIRFQGTVTQPAANRLILTRNFDLETYSIPPEPRLEALQALRLRIDEQDLNILGAIEQRGRIVEEILALKQSAGFPAFDAIRERQLLQRLHAMYRGPYPWQDVEQVFRTLLEMSRTLPVPTR